MIALVAYDLDFNVCYDYNSASIDADTIVDAVYLFDDKEQAREFLPEFRKKHPDLRYASIEVIEPLREKLEREKYEKRMRGDWS